MKKIIEIIQEATQTRATIGCGLTLAVPPEQSLGSLLLPLCNNNPDVDVMIGIPWWEAPLNVPDVVACELEANEKPKWINRALAALGTKIYLCTKLEKLSEGYIRIVLADAMGEAIDDRILTGEGADGLMGVIGGSTSVAVKNKTAGIVTLADIDVMVSGLRPRFQPDCVLGVNNTDWAGLKAEAKSLQCCGRIDEAAQTIDGRRTVISGAVARGKACAFNPTRFLVGGGGISVGECSDCGNIGKWLPVSAWIAGGLSGTPLYGWASGVYLDGTAETP